MQKIYAMLGLPSKYCGKASLLITLNTIEESSIASADVVSKSAVIVFVNQVDLTRFEYC